MKGTARLDQAPLVAAIAQELVRQGLTRFSIDELLWVRECAEELCDEIDLDSTGDEIDTDNP